MAKKSNLKVLRNEAIQKQQKLKDFEFKNVSDLVPFTIPSRNLKYFKEQISKVSNVEIKLVKDSKDLKDSKIVHIQTKEVVAIDSMKLGLILADAAKIADDMVKADRAAKAAASVKKPIRFKMDKATAVAFRDGCDKGTYPFDVLRYSYKSDKECHLWLNTSHVQGRTAYTAFVLKVADVINSIKTGFRKKLELAWIESVALDLQPAVMDKDSEQYVEMTGQQMIDQNLCNIFDIDSKLANGFQKFLKTLFKKRKFQYMYHGQVVQPSSSYIVFLEQPRKIETERVNHLHEMLLRYEFGENVHSGFGLKLVENYYKEIAELYNLNMAESQKDKPSDIQEF
jgi:hypothetical protein